MAALFISCLDSGGSSRAVGDEATTSCHILGTCGTTMPPREHREAASGVSESDVCLSARMCVCVLT